MKLLFLQEFPLSGKGGGAYIYKRLLSFAKHFNVDITIGYENSIYHKPINEEYETLVFESRNRNFSFGMGRLLSLLSIIGIDRKASISLNKVIEECQPNLVHLTAHGVCFPATAYATQKAGLPYVVTVHDVWDLSVQFIPKWLAHFIFRKIVKRAKMVFVISENMGKYLKKRYDINDFVIVHDGIAPDLELKIKNKSADGVIRLMYAGILHPMQKAIFNDVITSMGSMPQFNFELHICTGIPYEDPQSSENIKIVNYGWVDENKLKIISESCDFGLLPLSFNLEDELFYRTSLMTKIPFYVGAQLPIFCIGPTNSSAVELIQELKIGFTVTNNDLNNFNKAISSLAILTNEKYQEFITHLKKTRETTFNINLITERFYNGINSCIKNDQKN